MGAEEAVYNASLFGTELTHDTFVADAPSGVASAARSAAAAPCIVAYLPDAASVEQALQATEDSGSLLFNTGALADDLRESGCHPRLFHVTASHAQRADALAAWAADQDLSAVTLLSGQTGDAASAGARDALKSAGVAVGEVVQSPYDVEDGAVWVTPSADLDVFAALEGQTVLAPHFPLEAQGIAHGPVLWHASLYKYGATQVSERFAERAGQPMGGVAYAGWLAMQIAADALAQTGSTDPDTLRTHLRTTTRFDGRKAAPISFRPWNQQARHELYVLTPDGTVDRSVPARMPDALDAQTEALDALGVSRGACSL